MGTLRNLALSGLCALAVSVASADSAWWEAETPTETNIPNPVDMNSPGNRTAEQQAKLSGGRWLTVGQPKDGTRAFARYTIRVPAKGTYDLYVRKFWKHGPFRWRFGAMDWRECGRDIALLDNTYLQKHWGANWVALGTVELQAGKLRFEIQSLDNKGCIDCFLLTNQPFAPRGKLRPGEKTGHAADGCFAWEPDPDPLDGTSPIDLGHLNEATAGANGYVRRDGERFRLGNGEPVRFWMVQANLQDNDRANIDRWAKRLRKNGVNLVRMQLSGLYSQYLRGNRDAFARSLGKIHYVVAALKKQGIYSYFGHLYWHTSDPLPKGIVPGFDKERTAVALPFLAPEFQTFYRGYAKAILDPVNPYTGVPLAKETALAFVEINNESSLLFHTFNPGRFSPAESALVEASFGAWAAARYGSVEDALAAWGPSRKHSPDRPAEGRLGVYGAGFLGGADWAVNQRNGKRAGDQLRWMVEAMRDYYERFRTMLRNDIGVGSLITASNWKTADDRILGGLERYSYTTTDAVLRNSYFSTEYPTKKAQQRFYAVEVNDIFGSVSALKTPSMPGPLATPLIHGHPFMVTENNWTRPNRFRAEWPLLVASYGSMMGIDGWCFFALGSSEWQTPMAVWDLNNPTVLGQFPGAALMYRRGDVAQPKGPAVHEKVGFASAFALQGTRIHAVSGKDALWVAAIGDKEGSSSTSKGSIDPRAFFVGPVRQEFHDGESRVDAIPLGDYIDPRAGTVASMTGELVWNYNQGVLRIDAPRAQGATGFLGAAGPIKLGQVTIESANEYGSVLVISLDGKPLAESKRILVQTATEDKPFGFATEPVGKHHRITDLGGYPLNVRRIAATITVRTRATQAIILDGNGYTTDRRADATSANGGLKLVLPDDAIYTLLQ